MNRYSQLMVVLVILGLGLCEAPGHPRSLNNTTQETTSEVYSGKDTGTKARVARKPKPKYTKDARKNRIKGTVILRCVFAANGKVTNIQVVSGLPDGLTENAIKAAQEIKFKPAVKDGKPVSMWMQLEYNFNLY